MTREVVRECAVCWWVYDPDGGDVDGEVPAGVAFEDLPDAWVCPRCHAPKARFVRPRESDAGAEDVARRLVAAYQVVAARMRGLPISNDALTVEAVGFRTCGGFVVGALVTPWFLNVVVVGLPLPPRGETTAVTFAGGRFEMNGSTEGLAHLSLPLLSPLLDVADQAAARALAVESLGLVLSGETSAAAGGSPLPPGASPAVGRRGLLSALLGG